MLTLLVTWTGQHKVFSNPESMGKIIDIAALLGRSTGLYASELKCRLLLCVLEGKLLDGVLRNICGIAVYLPSIPCIFLFTILFPAKEIVY